MALIDVQKKQTCENLVATIQGRVIGALVATDSIVLIRATETINALTHSRVLMPHYICTIIKSTSVGNGKVVGE